MLRPELSGHQLMHLTREQVHIDGLANRFFRSNEITNTFNDLTGALRVVFNRLYVFQQLGSAQVVGLQTTLNHVGVQQNGGEGLVQFVAQ